MNESELKKVGESQRGQNFVRQKYHFYLVCGFPRKEGKEMKWKILIEIFIGLFLLYVSFAIAGILTFGVFGGLFGED